MTGITRKLEHRIQHLLSHYPKAYALVVGVGIVLFWRGIWHTVDQIHLLISHYETISNLSLLSTPWWDGPLSFIVGCAILYFTGAFTSSFIGNELILSGLRGEKRLTEKAQTGIQNEVRAVADIKDELISISEHLEELKVRLKNHTAAGEKEINY